MQLKIYPNYDSLSFETATLIADFVNKKPDSLICVASGHTPIGVFKALNEKRLSGAMNFSQCTFISLDEWLDIEPTDPGSCLAMLHRDCFDLLEITPRQIQFFDVNANLQAECNRMNTLIKNNGGLDVMLVGVGTNGHIGMNEPGTPFTSYAHISQLTEETIKVGQKYFERETVLSRGITLGLQHLAEARLPIVMASGKTKAPILAKALTGTATETIPVSIVNTIRQGYIMLDQEAADFQ